jgi:hypothetical protein
MAHAPPHHSNTIAVCGRFGSASARDNMPMCTMPPPQCPNNSWDYTPMHEARAYRRFTNAARGTATARRCTRALISSSAPESAWPAMLRRPARTSRRWPLPSALGPGLAPLTPLMPLTPLTPLTPLVSLSLRSAVRCAASPPCGHRGFACPMTSRVGSHNGACERAGSVWHQSGAMFAEIQPLALSCMVRRRVTHRVSRVTHRVSRVTHRVSRELRTALVRTM